VRPGASSERAVILAPTGRDAAVAAALRACGVRTLIHGHTHRPAVHEFELDGRPARRIVLGPIDLRVEPGEHWVVLGPNGAWIIAAQATRVFNLRFCDSQAVSCGFLSLLAQK